MTKGNVQIPFSLGNDFSELGIIGSCIYTLLTEKDNGLSMFSPNSLKYSKNNKKNPNNSFQKLHHVHFIQINVWMKMISVH